MSHDTEQDQPTTYGMLAAFESPEELLSAAEKARDNGYRNMDAYSSFPIDGMMEALGKAKTKLPAVILTGGAIGCLTGLGLQSWTSASDLTLSFGPYIFSGYPMNIGGRPMLSFVNFIPVTFELTVLFAAICAFLGTIILNKLPMPYHPLFNAEKFSRASQDRFFLCIESRDPQFESSKTREFLESLKPESVDEVEN
jgi:hypothetical protein